MKKQKIFLLALLAIAYSLHAGASDLGDAVMREDCLATSSFTDIEHQAALGNTNDAISQISELATALESRPRCKHELRETALRSLTTGVWMGAHDDAAAALIGLFGDMSSEHPLTRESIILDESFAPPITSPQKLNSIYHAE